MRGKQISIVAAVFAASFVFAVKSSSGQTIENLGMRTPNVLLNAGSLSGVRAMRPDFTPAFNAPGLTTPGMLNTLVAGQHQLTNPVVAADSLGFFNDSDQSLSFQLFIKGAARKIELGPRQIFIVQIDGSETDLKGVIGTGANDFSLPLSKAKIYVVRAESGRWVLAAL